jgi:hypothetical protein
MGRNPWETARICLILTCWRWMKRTSISTLLAFATLAITTAHAGVLDDWGKPALLKEFFMQYRIKLHQQGTHITSITLDRKGKASG